jgi:hypothetical protein
MVIIERENKAIQEAQEKGALYNPELLNNGDT